MYGKVVVLSWLVLSGLLTGSVMRYGLLPLIGAGLFWVGTVSVRYDHVRAANGSSEGWSGTVR